MSPEPLRRYRAERLLREQFGALRAQVLASARRRLRASGVDLAQADLEACYAMAWQGLYGAVLGGQEIASPLGWLVLVTYRRAIEEHRSSSRAERSLPDGAEQADERDLAEQLDDNRTLRQLFAGLRTRLDAREREAAMLCYLQGMSRPQAAATMGLSRPAMSKLMDGRGRGRPGVARKVGKLVRSIDAGSFCEEQASLMRAHAYGVLDPRGERHRLAVLHREECPACRAYVISLRGLAAVLPPVLTPWGVGARVLAGASGGGAAISATAGPGTLAATGALGAATSGSAPGSWALASGLAGKLAAGCLLALGVGAGCAVLGVRPPLAGAPERRLPAHPRTVGASARVSYRGPAITPTPVPASRAVRAQPPAPSAVREFGLGGLAGSASSVQRHSSLRAARTARVGSQPPRATRLRTSSQQPGSVDAEAGASREFAPG
jgi:RNA polymerase sigma factor (sigma-70 family)